ncbi:MAG TPA: glycosyltransferase family 4 protein [Anaerolineae bacterium]|nr:glycosyltransferase family 4 protein [Anaerolineae bacterium]
MTGTRPLHIGFVATRFAGTDGVSLESEKWAVELRAMGHDVFYFAGIVDRPAGQSREVPEAFFGHPDVAAISASVFGAATAARPESVSRAIDQLSAHLRSELRAFVQDYELDLLLPENALAIPMHLPLGLAITQLAAETGMPVLAHHHDLPWERQRFLVNSVADILGTAFPPPLPNVRHVCINSAQQAEIARRLGRVARVIPNVMDFEHPPPAPDRVTAGLRAGLGLADDEVFALQPVRVIPRKGIEHAVELVARLGRPARLVISHASGDEGMDYEARIREFARLLGVDVLWAADRVADVRGATADGRPSYSLADMYDACDLVTYPSLIEGFGNAYLEAVYHRRPVLLNRYPVYDLDIRPTGVRNIEMNGFVTEAAVEATRALLDDPARIAEWTEANYQLGLRHFSHRVVRDGLRAELEAFFPA